VNKAQLIEAVATDLGDRKVAEQAVANFLDVVVRTVAAGEKVTLSGFGTWERRSRAARTARNPATGAKIKLKATHVAAFKAGVQFKQITAAGKMPKAAKATAAPKATAQRAATAKKSATAKGAARAVTKSAPVKAAVAAVKKAPATKVTPANKAASKTPAKPTRTPGK
jgi:DNA-binding protein HU-beta